MPDERSGIASAINDNVSRVAALLAVAAFGILFASAFRHSLPPSNATQPAARALIQQARNRPTAAPELTIPASLRRDIAPRIRRASVDGYRAAMLAGLAGGALGAAVSLIGVRNPIPTRRDS